LAALDVRILMPWIDNEKRIGVGDGG